MAKRMTPHRAPLYKAKKDLRKLRDFPGGTTPLPKPYTGAKARISGGSALADTVTSSLKGRLPRYRAASETLAKRGLDAADVDAERKLRHASARSGTYKGTSHRDALVDAMKASAGRRSASATGILKSEIDRKKGISATSAGLKDLAARGRLTGTGVIPDKMPDMKKSLASVFGKTAAGASGYTPYRGPMGVKKSAISPFPW